MPAYNEEGSIRSAVKEVQEHVFPHITDVELLVINDGSTDHTGEILNQLATTDSRICVVHQTNGGHGRALRTGLDQAKKDYLFLIDSDQQIPLDTFPEMWDQAVAGDGVFGLRANREDPRLRRVLSALIRFVAGVLFQLRLSDPNAPYKIFKRSIWSESRRLIPEYTLAPSLFLAIFVRVRGFAVAECALAHRERRTGEVSIRSWKLLKLLVRAFGQLLAFRLRLR